MTRTTNDVLKEASRVLARQEKLKREARDLEAQVRKLCLEYGQVSGMWGVAPYHLKCAVEMRLNKKIAA